MKDKDIFHLNLLTLLKLFQEKPNHLAKFLIDNNALTDKFIKKIKDSHKLIDISEKGINDKDLHFNTINDMNLFYKNLIDDLETIKKRKSKKDLIIELNSKIENAITIENYEEAARIRDYMIKNNLK